MKLLVVLMGLLLALPGAAQSQKPAQAAAPVLSKDGKAVMDYFDEIGAFIRQVLTQPNDTQALLLLHGPKRDHLKQRYQQIQPALVRWRSSLSQDQRETASNRIMQQSRFAKDMEWLKNDAATTARLKRSPNLQAALGRTMNELLAR